MRWFDGKLDPPLSAIRVILLYRDKSKMSLKKNVVAFYASNIYLLRKKRIEETINMVLELFAFLLTKFFGVKVFRHSRCR